MDPDYLGHNFLRLREPNGKQIRPMYSNGGAYLRWVNHENTLCARYTRAILNHAPLGDYMHRFNIPGYDTHECECGCPGRQQNRHHIFTWCGVLLTNNSDPRFIQELVDYLEENPKAFAFSSHTPIGDG